MNDNGTNVQAAREFDETASQCVAHTMYMRYEMVVNMKPMSQVCSELEKLWNSTDAHGVETLMLQFQTYLHEASQKTSRGHTLFSRASQSIRRAPPFSSSIKREAVIMEPKLWENYYQLRGGVAISAKRAEEERRRGAFKTL